MFQPIALFRTLGLFISIQKTKSEACRLFSRQYVILKKGKALITAKALRLYRPMEACGLWESIFQPIVQA